MKTEATRKTSSKDFVLRHDGGDEYTIIMERGNETFTQPGGRRSGYVRGASLAHSVDQAFVDRVLEVFPD